MKKKSHYGTVGSILIPDEDIKEFTLPELVEKALEERTKEILEMLKEIKSGVEIHHTSNDVIDYCINEIKTKYGL